MPSPFVCAFASAEASMVRMPWHAFAANLPAAMPCLCPVLSLNIFIGMGLLRLMASSRIFFAFGSGLPRMWLHISIDFFVDISSAIPTARAEFSPVFAEYV